MVYIDFYERNVKPSLSLSLPLSIVKRTPLDACKKVVGKGTEIHVKMMGGIININSNIQEKEKGEEAKETKRGPKPSKMEVDDEDDEDEDIEMTDVTAQRERERDNLVIGRCKMDKETMNLI